MVMVGIFKLSKERLSLVQNFNKIFTFSETNYVVLAISFLKTFLQEIDSYQIYTNQYIACKIAAAIYAASSVVQY